ncbi:MAG: LCP family protein [Actinomycetota bacterium]|nr:LCP family protein [Actinomycetota bacterium]
MTADDHRGRPMGSRARRRRDLQARNRRSFVLTALAIVPGAGLTRTRHRLFGWILLAVCLVGLVAGLLLVRAKGLMGAALGVAVNPDLLLAIAGLAAVGGLVWIFSVVLTNRESEPTDADPRSRFALRLFTGLVCVLVALPTIQVVRYASIQRDVVGSVFSRGSLPQDNPSAARPNQTAADSWKDVARVNMLLLGSDAGSDRTGVRTDSMVVASIDTKTGNTALISIPRSLQRVPFPASNPLRKLYPNGYYCPDAKPGDECLINGVWALAEQHKDLFKNDKNPGLTTIRGVISEVTGLSIDDTTVVDLAGFQSLVDAMGGVRVNVTERLPVNGYHTASGAIAGVEGWIEPGNQLLDGYHALWFARSRLTTDDYSRMRRQRCLIGTILDQVNPGTMLGKYPQLAQVAKNNIQTDINVADLPAWVDLVQRIQKGSITSLTFTEDIINTTRPDYAKIRQLVANAVNPPPAATGEATGTAGPTPTGTATSTKTPSPTTTKRPQDTTAPVNVREAC